jgi:hypothetical protein
MNFEEFKKRYIEKLGRGGFVTPTDPEELAAFEDKMADIYLGLMIYSEYQNEQTKKQMAEYKKQQREEMERNKQLLGQSRGIVLPGRFH